MRVTALLGATCLALTTAPAFAFGGFLDDLNPFAPDRAPYYRAYSHHHHHRHHHHRGGYAMVAPGVMHTPHGMFLYDDTLGEWEHWKD